MVGTSTTKVNRKEKHRCIFCGKLEVTLFFDANGEYHSDDGPAESCNNCNKKFWFKHGKLHREGAPAVVSEDGEIWYCEGLIHRLDGPATSSGYFFIQGVAYSKEEFNSHPLVLFYRLSKEHPEHLHDPEG